MVFAAGFEPYKLATNVVLDSDGDNIKIIWIMMMTTMEFSMSMINVH